MKLKLLLLFVVLFLLQSNAQTLNPTESITAAGSADTFKGGYTFAHPSSGTPWSGPLISFGGFSNQYDCQLNSNYGGNNISFRTRNGDIGTWNAWNELATRGVNTFNGNQTVNGDLNFFLDSNKIIWYSDSDNYYIGTFPVTGSAGLDIHSYGGIRFGDGSSNSVMQITNSKVGIGTTTPTNALTVQKVSGGVGFSGTDGTGGVRVNWSSGYGVALDAWDGYEPRWGITRFSENTPTVILEGKYNSKDAYFNSGGNVGIGTTDPKNKLSVNGIIWAKEVKVSLTDAADWVFEKNYKLKPLAEIEKYINENKHLPEVPSAEEFRQNDMNVSQMSNKLLQKVEELTLYAIEQNKEIERLKKEKNIQSKKIETVEKENDILKELSKRISKIENKLK